MRKPKTRAVLIDDCVYQTKADGSLVPLKGKTDWKRLDSFSMADIEAMASADPEGPPMPDDAWRKSEIVQPQKVAVGLKLDDDVLGWFRAQGKGYQTRINMILRRYYETHRKAG